MTTQVVVIANGYIAAQEDTAQLSGKFYSLQD